MRPFHSLIGPEGIRYCVLFAAAPGAKPAPPFTLDLYDHFGRAAGAMHRAADDFVSTHQRFQLDLTRLLDAPLAAIRPYLAHRPHEWFALTRLAERIRARMIDLAAAGLDWGVCHGDLTLDCFTVSADHQITFYDFDSGGPGWRAMEFEGMYHHAPHNWEAFLKGYSESRRLGPLDLAALPWCVSLYAIFDMGWAAQSWARWSGQWRVDEAYWSEKLGWLAQWEAQHLDGA